ncbi:MAG: 6-carboxytetrahydropterin synthase [Fimbriiglobus sp.]|jgi:6-pyruvoyltetrahydropterin/6-carboxytetrahydropterin synthase|nr:6-carboxytetrahydropterin synthase [Fimbriiglobus sp.]
MPADRYHIRVTKDYLVFCCGHFITYDGDDCERLHGHNYRVAVEVDGLLDRNHYVFDFIALKHRTREIVDELDHHMLLATKNPLLPIEDAGSNWVVRYKEKFWSFPKEDCILLPIENTTTELLAKWMAGRLVEVLHAKYQFVPEVMRVEVEENVGQVAVYEWRR